jgi:hypothetical protein
VIRAIKKYHLRLTSGLDDLLLVLRGMTDEQRRFRPEPDDWSALEVAHHVFLAERLTVTSLEKLRGQPSRKRGLKAKFGKLAVAVVFKLGIPVENPSKMVTPDPAVGFDELESEWREVREQMLEVLEAMDEDAPGQAGMSHPFAGPMTVRETLAFLAAHLERHLGQMRRLRSEKSFPAG